MGLTWICFGGKKERARQAHADFRARHDNIQNTSSLQTPRPKSISLGVQLKSPIDEAYAYEEPFQPKQAVSGPLRGRKLFIGTTITRAKSFGSSNAFENGAKRHLNKNTEAQSADCVDRLQEEVENLRRRLAEEEEEARKLRHEVFYLRSCGVLQSPDRYKNCCNFETESAASKDDHAQRHLHSWLGLALSPASRFTLEEQLRCMAADELSKVPDRGLTNGQKALIVATKLWEYNGDPQQDKQIKCELDVPGDNASLRNVALPDSFLSEGTQSDQFRRESRDFDYHLSSSILDPIFRDNLELGKDSNIVKANGVASPLPTHDNNERLSLHLSTIDDHDSKAQLRLEKRAVKKFTSLHRALSCPERVTNPVTVKYQNEQMTANCTSYVLDNRKVDSPKKSHSLPSPGTSCQVSKNVKRRQSIDLPYQELEEKLLKSPNEETSRTETSPPHQKKTLQPVIASDLEKGTEPDGSYPEVLAFTESKADSATESDSSNSVCSLALQPFFTCKYGRLWQPLSPVWETDSGRSSEEHLDTMSSGQVLTSDKADSAKPGEHKSSMRSNLSGNKQEHSYNHTHDIGEVLDEDLFTLSPGRLHQNYNRLDDSQRVHDEAENGQRPDANADFGVATSWISSEETDFNDIVPIQCQSPAFSPKQKSFRKKSNNGKDFKLEEYPRDKYFKEMGLKVEEFLSSSDSCTSTEFPVVEKENFERSEICPVVDIGQGTQTGPSKETSPHWKKSSVANDLLFSQSTGHPVLASIENLPVWIECHGVTVEKESQYQATQTLDKEDHTMERQDSPGEASDLKCHSQPSRLMTRNIESGSQGECLELKDEQTLEFSARGGKIYLQTGESLDDLQGESRSRLSLHGFVYQRDGDTMDSRCSSSTGSLVQEQQYLEITSGTERTNNDFSNQGGALDNVLMTLVGEAEGITGLDHYEHEERIEFADHEERSCIHSQDSMRQADLSEGNHSGHYDERKTRGSMDNNDSRGQNLGHLQQMSLNDFSSTTEPGLETSGGGDSEQSSATSRDSDETFHECESPTLVDIQMQPAQSSSPPSDKPVDMTPTKLLISRNGHTGKRTLDISPDDRPILGTVATHWGETKNTKSRREWDGLGIPNSTSKFKEDQLVNWHTIPFETRLEQALAKQTIVPEMCNQRQLLEGVSLT